MNKNQYILRNFNVMNLLLLAAAMVMFFTLAYPFLNYDPNIRIPKVNAVTEMKAEKTAEQAAPAAADYIIVAEKNLFHPERRIPAEKKEEQVVVRPEIIYYGSIITHEKKIAYIEDKKNPYSTPGRGKRQTPVAEGAMIGGYALKEVNPETLVLVRGDDKMVVNLRDQKDRKGGESSFKSHASSSQVHTPPPLPRPVMPLGSIPPPIPARPVVNPSRR